MFPNALAVTVKSAAGVAVPGVSVTFTALASTVSGTFSNGTATITVTTNSSGVASAPITANTTIGGPFFVTATAAGYPKATFLLTNEPAMSPNPGTSPQTAVVGAAFAIAPGVTIVNSSGKPLAGVSVTFTAPPTGASGTFSNAAAAITVATNSAGVAAAPFTANGIAGSYSITAAAPGYSGVQFNMKNLAGAAAGMSANVGTTPQSVKVLTQFATALAVTVRDARGNLARGVNVTFAAPTTGATGVFADGLSTATAATDASGVASVVLTAGAVPGSFTATASTAGATAISFTLTVTVGLPATMTINSGSSPQSARINTVFATPLAVTVKDIVGNPVPGAAVTFALPGLINGTVIGGAVTTNALGIASVNVTSTQVPLTYVIVAAVNGVPPVYFMLSATP